MTNKRTKKDAGRNEREDVDFIVKSIHLRTPVGLKLMESFETEFGLEILDAKIPDGRQNRSRHYDFLALIGPPPGEWKNVEHKGSIIYKSIPDSQTAWKASVQYANIGCEKFEEIILLYHNIWYDIYIGSGLLKKKYDIEAPIPSRDESFHKDAKVQGDPTTDFTKELKKKIREKGETSLLKERALVNENFNPSEEVLNRFKEKLLEVINSFLKEKEYWLTIHGDVQSGEFYCKWFPQYIVSTIHSIKIRKERDIFFDIVTDKGDLSCILRWGKGAGFSNLRIDCR